VGSIAQTISSGEYEMEEHDIEEYGGPCASHYLMDALDIEYIVSSDKSYLGARVLVTFGGPNIWINTRTKTVEGYWWGDTHFASFDDELGLDDWLAEYYECI
jgi:hypothetical protein